jgi:DNA-binding Lrp family transcriptional regulator
MPRTKLTEDLLKQYLGLGMAQKEIARLFGVSEAAVSQRVKRLEKRVAPKCLPVVQAAESSVWDMKAATEANYRRALALLDELAEPGDKIRCIGEIRQHLTHAMNVLQAMYSVQEAKEFQEEVLQVLDECEPGLRDKILTRLRERRTIRAAFGAGRPALPGRAGA